MTFYFGIALAFACALVTQLGFLYKHRGACAAPSVDVRHPLRTIRCLFRSRWFAIGMAVGFLVAEIRGRLDDAPTELTISLLTAYAAFIPADELGLSGVLAAVTAGVYLGWRAPELITPETGRPLRGGGALRMAAGNTTRVAKADLVLTMMLKIEEDDEHARF